MPVHPHAKTNVALIVFIVLFVLSATGLGIVSTHLVSALDQMNLGLTPSTPGAAKYAEAKGLKMKLLERDRNIDELGAEIERFKKVVGVESVTKLEETFKNRLQAIKEGVGEPGPAEAQTVMAFVHVLEKEKVLLTERIREQLRAHETERAKLAARIAEEEIKTQEKQKAVEERDAQIEKLNASITEEHTASQQEIGTLRAEVDKARDETKNLTKDKNQQIDLLDKEIVRLKEQLKTLRKERTFEGKPTEYDSERETADGRIILVDRDAGIIVDIGMKKGVRRGLRFEVYTSKPDGTRVRRGDIEIKTVHPEISRANFIGTGDPLELFHAGDIIVNLAFDPGRARLFVADSVFDDAKKQAFREALAEYGSVLEDELTIRTDYLIVGAQSSATGAGGLVSRAEKLGITIIREEDLNRLLGRQ